jgi:hypothetical protein
VIERNPKPLHNVRPFLSLIQFKLGSANHNVMPMLHIMLQHLLERQRHRLSVHQRQHIHAETILKPRARV